MEGRKIVQDEIRIGIVRNKHLNEEADARSGALVVGQAATSS
jgi:hypothetical protein